LLLSDDRSHSRHHKERDMGHDMGHDEIAAARKIVRDEAEHQLVAHIEAAVAAGTAEWVLDPEVDGVVGLVRTGTGQALIVVYVGEGDWEMDDEFEGEVFATVVPDGTTVCGACGPSCSSPETVEGACDAFGPVCLSVAYECPCANCDER
jgi:hypothetical protein